MVSPVGPPAESRPGIEVRVPAKVNLQLSVGEPRPDGYHPLTTVFLALDWYDHLHATLAGPGQVEVTVTGEQAAHVPTDERNLAVRAARLLAARFGVNAGVRLHIVKDIPVAAGMAGGSADAAAALLACNTLWNTGATAAELHDLASQLGSDVPFALLGGAALGTGRGDHLTPLPVTGTFHWALAVADQPLPTPAVYHEHDRLRHVPTPPRPAAPDGSSGADPALLEALRLGDAKALGAALSNDLHTAALSLCPALTTTLHAGTAAGALGSLVCGSGPTTAFLAANARHAHALAGALTRSGTCHRARTAQGPAPGGTVRVSPISGP